MAEVLSRGKKHILGESSLFFEQQMKKFDGNSGSSSSSMYVSGSSWTSRENKLFEKALAMYDSKTPDRWQKVVAMIPGKTASDAFKHYQELEADVNCIEAGLIDIPSYSNSTFTLELGSGDHHHDGLKNFTSNGSKRGGLGGRGGDQERKKGVPWTEEEHRLFLLGLEKYGKGDWRNISRNFVVTKTPTQVASHAQKYFIRLSSGSKDKRRSSIHDITTVNITDKNLPSLSRSQTVPSQSVTVTSPRGLDGFKLLFDQNSTSEGTSCLSSPTCQPQGKFSLPYPVNPFLNTAETHHLSNNMIHELQLGMQDHRFQIQQQQHPFGGYNE